MKYYLVLYKSGTATIVFARNKQEAQKLAVIGDLEVETISVLQGSPERR